MEKQLLSLNQIKKIELDILIAFTKFCDDHNLRYFLAYGSLLGAVRHGGFIPWDDDIDVVMMRSDYMKLNDLLCHESIREDLEWVSIQNGKWDEPFGKLVNKNTIIKLERTNSSIWIDIFPLDFYDKKLFKKNIFMRRVHIAKTTNHFDFSKKGIVKFLLKNIYFWKSLKSISEDIELRSKSAPHSDKIAHMVWASDNRDVHDKVMFSSCSTVTFEGLSFKTVANIDLYLKTIYGNYMELPPVSARKTHEITGFWIGNNVCPF